MARVRLFIAVDIGASVRKRAAALQEKLARTTSAVKWVEPENMHLTLLFLGEVAELEVVSICRVVAEQAALLPEFTMELTGVGAFPTARRPKVLWIGIRQGADELRRIHDALETPLLELGGFRRENRAYTPHLTLGRLTEEDSAGSWTSTLPKHADWDGGSTRVAEILVMRSDLGRNGPTYSVMGRAKLQRTEG